MIKSRIMRWAGHVARMGDRIVAYRVSMGKPEGKRQFGTHRRRWRIVIEWIIIYRLDCIGLAQERGRRRALVYAGMNLWVSYNAGIS